MSQKKNRRSFTAAQKVAIVKRHLIDKVPISEVCEEHQIQPTLFYQWQKTLFEKGTAAFERKGKAERATLHRRKVARLEEKLATKNEVIAELMEENVKAKKANGEL